MGQASDGLSVTDLYLQALARVTFQTWFTSILGVLGDL